MKNSEKEHTVTISLPILIYMVYLSFLVLCDAVNFGAYMLCGGRIPIPALLLLGIVLIFLVYRFREYIHIEKQRMDLVAYIFLALIFILAFFRGILPDTSYDVMNARVFWQFPGFQDNIDYNTFPAAWTFFFPLPDRVFYYPRVILGYRLGTMMNALLLALFFLEARNLVETLLGDKLSVLEKSMAGYSKETQAVVGIIFGKSFLAAVSCLLFYIIAELGTYMVDLTALPLLLLLIRKVVARECDTFSGEIIFTAYVAGICFGLKMTNIIFLVPIIIIYIVKNRRYIHFGNFTVCVLIGIFPSISYLLYAYLSTGNPVFWTYNSIFKSPYHIDVDFKDMRWGPESIRDYIFWPLKMVIDYDSRITELARLPQIYILLGTVSSIYLTIKACVKRIWDKGMSVFILLFWIFYILWLYSTGYARYAIICETMAVIICVYAVCELLTADKKAQRILAITIMLALVLQMQLNYIEGLNNRYDWSWRGTIADNITNGKLAANMKWLLRDRGNIGTDEQREKVDIFLESYTSSQYMKMFDENIPIINGSYVQSYLAQVYEVKGIDYPTYYREKIVKALMEGKGVYDLLRPEHIQYAVNLANAWGLQITECEYIESYYTWDRSPVLIRYELADEENEYHLVNHVDIDTSIFQGTHDVSLRGIAYLDSASASNCTLIVKTEWADGGNIEQKLSLRAGQLYDLSQYFNISDVDSRDKVYLQVLEEGINVNIANLGFVQY